VADPPNTRIEVDDETTRLAPSDEDAAPCLLVVGPDGAVAHPLPPRGQLTLGRSSGCDIVVDDSSISRRHAQVIVGPPLCIQDLGSANGVRVGQVLLEPNTPVVVEPGTVIELGSVVVVLHRPSMLAVTAAAPPRPSAGADERPSLMPDGPPLVRDPGMQRLYAIVERVARSDLSVLLLGETGAGKEVVAERIHACSARASGPLLSLNCSAIAENLVESELFGHERGAFTGAHKTKPGLLESADGGTVFLDEVGELPASTQAKLLRVIEERQVMRVGGLEPRPIDVRFIAATNRELKAMADAGTFRTDLYFRLNGISLRIPPLRERPSEIEPLARRFVARITGASPSATISAHALHLLQRYGWPGNVRELRNFMERAAVLAGGSPITADHLPPEVTGRHTAHPEPQPGPGSGSSLRSEMGELERRRILDALEQCSGNQTKAAELLGMPRRTFVKRLDAYGIPRPRKGTRST